MTEMWKDAWWTQGVFQVSNYGRVYNTKTKRFLKGNKKDTGYIQIDLCYNGTRQKWDLHRLVATVWQRPLVKGEDAHHKNKFTWCNCRWNIQIKDSKKHAQEHAKERAETMKGVPRSQQTKAKIRETKIKNGTLNKQAWNKGVPMSQQQKQKLSKAHKGKKLSQQTKKKMSETAKQKMKERYKDPLTGRFTKRIEQ